MPIYHVTASELTWQKYEVEAANAEEAQAKIMEFTDLGKEPRNDVKAVSSGEGDFEITDTEEVTGWVNGQAVYA